MTGTTFRAASPADLGGVAELLRQSRLPLVGVEAQIGRFLLAFHGEALAGCAALERYGRAALLRSVAVAESKRGAGLGRQLVAKSLEGARGEGIETVLLLTTTAASFFARFGFKTISRAEAPAAVQCSVEFQGACPDSATVMQLDLPRPREYTSIGRDSSRPAIDRGVEVITPKGA